MDKTTNRNAIVIEKASKHMADAAARLTQIAYKDFSYDMFGVDKDEKALEYYRYLWQREDNRFSYRYSYVARINKEPVGLMTCYPSNLTKKLVYPTITQLAKIGGMSFVKHVIKHIGYFGQFANTAEAYPDEFYIGTLAVLPEYRDRKIGAKLLKHMRAIAKDQGFNKCSLLVDAVNVDAIRFYEQNGFEKVSYSEKPRAYYRMLKR